MKIQTKSIAQKSETCDKIETANGGAGLQIIDDPKTIPHAVKMTLVEPLAQYIVKRIKQTLQERVQ